MRSHIRNLAIFSVLAVLPAFVPAAHAEEALSPEQTKAVQAVIGDYLKDHPEAILDSLESYRQRQQEKMRSDAAENIKKYNDFLTAADAPSIGNPQGAVTVVEFFDYNCGYCKRALPDIQHLVKTNDDVRIVFHDMPILSPDSLEAAKWAVAAHKQGKYFDFHKILMQHRGELTVSGLKRMAKDAGLDPEQMEKDANTPETSEAIEKGVSAAREIGVQGTPAFVVNGQFYPGYLGEGGLQKAVEDARKKAEKG